MLACREKQQAIDRCSVAQSSPTRLALSTLQMARDHHLTSPAASGELVSFPPPEGRLLKSPTGPMVTQTMKQSCAANETQAEEMSSHVYLPNKEDAAQLKVVIVAASWQGSVVDSIVSGVTTELCSYGINEANIGLVRVPTLFNLPQVCIPRCGQRG